MRNVNVNEHVNVKILMYDAYFGYYGNKRRNLMRNKIL